MVIPNIEIILFLKLKVQIYTFKLKVQIYVFSKNTQKLTDISFLQACLSTGFQHKLL